MPFLFTPPTVKRAVGLDRFWSRYSIDVGTTLLKHGEFYSSVTYPSSEDLEAADLFYLGGFFYLVDDDEAEALTEAGYADFLTEPPDPEDPDNPPPPLPDPSEYGAGPFGDGIFGR